MSKHVYHVVYECDDHTLTVRVAVDPNTDKNVEKDEALYAATNALSQQWQANPAETPAKWVTIEWVGAVAEWTAN